MLANILSFMKKISQEVNSALCPYKLHLLLLSDLHGQKLHQKYVLPNHPRGQLFSVHFPPLPKPGLLTTHRTKSAVKCCVQEKLQDLSLTAQHKERNQMPNETEVLLDNSNSKGHTLKSNRKAPTRPYQRQIQQRTLTKEQIRAPCSPKGAHCSSHLLWHKAPRTIFTLVSPR